MTALTDVSNRQGDALCDTFYADCQQVIDASGVQLRLQHAGPRFGLYFGVTGEIIEYRKAASKNHAAETLFVRACYERGVYFQPAAHYGFSAVHAGADLQLALKVIAAALSDVRAAQRGARP